MSINHYKWLDEYLPEFMERVGVDWNSCPGIVTAHGDKGYGYRAQWEESNIPFHKGMAVYLLTYVRPYDQEARQQQDNTWISPEQWVIDNYRRFKGILDEFPDDIENSADIKQESNEIT